MRLLLDTHVLIWWLTNPDRLTQSARQAIRNPQSDIYVSAVSVWEISIMKSVGKLSAPDDIEDQLARHRFIPLPISVAHAAAAADLPLYHRDLFDRLLVVQARIENLLLLTYDQQLEAYDVALFREDR